MRSQIQEKETMDVYMIRETLPFMALLPMLGSYTKNSRITLDLSRIWDRLFKKENGGIGISVDAKEDHKTVILYKMI